ncbi:hypothetical protein DEJ13_17965 (plasmid) [Curtobacterium sp. MCLR17_007]|uniref:hypothetical protein n=1 Tax=Curtobacterium sp. MCLR17_007 TaxID=2175648 RepID=UPI000DAA886D|nr:hypothetical protein [Curtobacterium sp. MCLR17_007]WIB62076.1 hypothetical protein DEJ13_17965 [Curtobacterium sp. MCLR17_007]
MKDLDVRPTRPDLAIFETLGGAAIVVLIAAAVAAAIGIAVWFAVPRLRGSRMIVRLWAVCAIIGFVAAVLAWLFLA